jgi:glycerol-1-phosphate dehydrogenase [NAD(P)+]
MFSHTLDQLAPGRAYHGEQVGLGAVMMMYLHGGDWKSVRAALAAVGAPTTAERLGVPREVVVEALCRAHLIRPDRYTILGDKGLSREAAEDLVRVTGVA